MSTPVAIVRLACGSMSMVRTRRPRSARAAATLRVLVVLAVPPFWLKKAMTRAMRLRLERDYATASSRCTYALGGYHMESASREVGDPACGDSWVARFLAFSQLRFPLGHHPITLIPRRDGRGATSHCG